MNQAIICGKNTTLLIFHEDLGSIPRKSVNSCAEHLQEAILQILINELKHYPALLYEHIKHYLLFEITKIIGKRKPNTCSISHMNTVKRRSLNVKNKVKDQCPRCGWLLKKLLISNHILCLRSSDSEFGSVQ